MRLERWPRSGAIFIGSAAFFFLYPDLLQRFTAASLVLRAGLSFLLTWFISTANYIINEMADAPYDIHHPTKRYRPLVQGEIKKIPFAFLGLLLIVSSLLAAFIFFPLSFFISLLALLVAGFIYNLKPVRTKDIPFLDSISESANNPIRFLIGWFALSPSSFLPPLSVLISWWAFGNFLMIAKRLSEFRLLKDKAGDYRTSHKKYSKNSLMLGMIASALIFFLAYFFFTFTFKLQYFLYVSPFLFLYLFFIFRKTLKEKEVMEEPEKLLLQPKFALYTLLLVIIYLLFFFLNRARLV
jgi:decaprenyl-phosphate phosphoribosyltransferase